MNLFGPALNPLGDVYMLLAGIAVWTLTICAPVIAVLTVRALWVRRNVTLSEYRIANALYDLSRIATSQQTMCISAERERAEEGELRAEIRAAGKVSQSAFGR